MVVATLGPRGKGQSHTISSEMAGVPAAELSDEQKGELLCTYSALILHDDGAEINPQSMTNLIKAAGCSVEGYWPMLMSKMINTVRILAVETMVSYGNHKNIITQRS